MPSDLRYNVLVVCYRRPTFKCKDVINANANFFPDSQLLETQSTYYVRGDESRRAQNAIIEFTISLKTRQCNLFTTHLNMGLRYLTIILFYTETFWTVTYKSGGVLLALQLLLLVTNTRLVGD